MIKGLSSQKGKSLMVAVKYFGITSLCQNSKRGKHEGFSTQHVSFLFKSQRIEAL